jgi:hypothetical protein
MSSFVEVNAEKCKLRIDVVIPKTMRVGLTRRNKILHAINEGSSATVCGRVSRESLKNLVDRCGTPYINFCAYCLARLQEGHRG